VKASPPAGNPRWQAHIERAKNMWPVPPQGWKYEAAIAGPSLVVRLTPPEGETAPASVAFFPERELLIEPAAPQKVTREGRALRIERKPAAPPLKDVTQVAGVAVSESGWPGISRKAIRIDAPVSAALSAAAAGSTDPASISEGNVGGSALLALVFA